ncbi:MAG: PEP-CTERM system TPR-repeat protein PrsT [Gammaproteobacteria bacterium]|nr:PEP-CTERM system TPR-repeat protein PrsT [Gammaproteobacteria bacterium]
MKVNTIVIGLLFLLLPHLVLAESKSDEFVKDARDYLEKNEINAAVIQLKNALQQDPAHMEARLMLGNVYLSIGDVLSAEKEFKRAQKLHAPKERWVSELGAALLTQKKYKEVLDLIELEENLPLDKQGAVYLLRGQAKYGLGEYEPAKEMLAKAQEYDAVKTDANVEMAKVLFSMKQNDQALARLSDILKESPNNTRALLVRAEYKRAIKDVDAALQDYNKITEIQPENIQALLGKTIIYIGKNDNDNAEMALKILDKLQASNPYIKYLHGMLSFQKKDYGKAGDYIQQVLEAMPDHVQSQLLYGMISYAMGDMALADEYLARSLASLPDHRPSKLMMAAARLHMRQYSNALKVLEPMIKNNPDDVQVMTMLGTAYIQLGRYQEGSDFIAKAVEIDPNQAPLHSQLALGLLAQGYTDQAKGQMDTAAQLGQTSAQSDLILIYTHLKNGKYEEALKATDELNVAMPDNPVVHNLSGLAQMAMGDLDKAEDSFKKALAVKPGFYTAEVNLAKLDIMRKDFKSADIFLRSVILNDESHIDGLLTFALLEQQRGNTKEMLSWLEKAYARNPDATRPGIALIKANISVGDTAQAVIVANTMAMKFPNNHQVIAMLGLSQVANKSFADAVITYNKLVESNKSSGTLIMLAKAQYSAKDMEGARKSLNEALKISPDNVVVLVTMATLELQSNNLPPALEIAEKLKAIAPLSAMGYEVEGGAKVIAKEIPAALDAFNKGYELQPTAKLAEKISKLHLSTGNSEKAHAILANWLEKKQDDTSIRSAYAMLLQQSGDKTAALKQYEILIDQNPKNIIALNNLAWLYSEGGDKRALDIGASAYRLSNHAPAVADTYGWALVQFGELGKGLGILQEAMGASNGEPEIAYHVGYTLNKMGKSDEAKGVLNKIIADHPETRAASDAKQLISEMK